MNKLKWLNISRSHTWLMEVFSVSITTSLLITLFLLLGSCSSITKREPVMSQKRPTFVPDSSLDAMEETIPKTVLKQYPSQPILRIGFMEGYEKIDFRISGEFSVTDLNGEPIFSGVTSHLKWRSLLDAAHGATFIYSILVTACREESKAADLVEKLKKLYPQVRMQRLGGQLVVAGQMINDNTKYRILAGAFETEAEAKKLLQKFTDGYAPRDAALYLPPAALVADPPRLPLIVFMMGQPGTPDPTSLAAALNAYAASHTGLCPPQSRRMTSARSRRLPGRWMSYLMLPVTSNWSARAPNARKRSPSASPWGAMTVMLRRASRVKAATRW